MEKARNQAEHYARALPGSEGRPPFLLIVDVGYSIELFAEFTCTGGTYVRFPDPKAHRIYVTELRDERKQETLKKIWTEPLSLDPPGAAPRSRARSPIISRSQPAPSKRRATTRRSLPSSSCVASSPCSPTIFLLRAGAQTFR